MDLFNIGFSMSLLYMFPVYHQGLAGMKPVLLLKDALKSNQVKYLYVIYNF